MSDNDKVSSVDTGSGTNAPAGGSTGQANTAPAAGDKSADYPELEKAFGRQGQELGEYREFIKGITPLLTELDKNPKLVQAILGNKIDASLGEALLDGRVSVGEAQQVADAHQKVKEDMGKKAYAAASSEEVTRRVEETMRAEMNQRFSEMEDQKEFEGTVNNFIDNTPDFPQYADKIVIWLNEHPDQDDIQIAYEAVKGKVLESEFKRQSQASSGEAAKQVAANAGGGNAPSSGQLPENEDLWDKLVSKKGNPNIL